MKTKRYCVLSPVGKDSLHRSWLSEQANFDLHLIVYDDSFENFRKDTPFIVEDKAYKLRLVYNYIATNEGFLDTYDYIYIPDDDIAIDVENIHRLFAYMDCYQLDLAQPALTDSYFYSFPCTLKQANSVLRYTNFVEMMQPCFSSQALKKVLFTFVENQHGWGADVHWGYLLDSLHNYNTAIIDDIISVHTRPVRSNYYAELEAYLQKFNLKLEIKELACILKINSQQKVALLLDSPIIEQVKKLFLVSLWRGFSSIAICDLVLVDNFLKIEVLSRKIKINHLPLVFLNHSDTEGNWIFPHKKLIKIIKTSYFLNPCRFGFAPEMVDMLPLPLDIPSDLKNIEPKNTETILYVYTGDKEELLQLIALMNRNTRKKWVVLAAPLWLKVYAEKHICFVSSIQRLEDFDLFIGSGKFLLAAILARIPAITFGKMGISGLVSPENYTRLKENDFLVNSSNCISTSLNEEIAATEQRTDSLKLREENFELLKNDFEACRLGQVWLDTLRQVLELDAKMKSAEDFATLKPLLLSNCSFEKNEDTFDIYNATLSLRLGNVGIEEYQLLQAFKGTQTITQIQNQFDIDQDELLAFVNYLFEKKILYFNL